MSRRLTTAAQRTENKRKYYNVFAWARLPIMNRLLTQLQPVQHLILAAIFIRIIPALRVIIAPDSQDQDCGIGDLVARGIERGVAGECSLSWGQVLLLVLVLTTLLILTLITIWMKVTDEMGSHAHFLPISLAVEEAGAGVCTCFTARGGGQAGGSALLLGIILGTGAGRPQGIYVVASILAGICKGPYISALVVTLTTICR